MDKLSEQETVKRWKADLPSFLELPETQDRVVELGYTILGDMPDLAADFITSHLGKEGEFTFLSFGEFLSFFDRTEKPPKMMTKAEVSALADEKYFPKELEKDKDVWKKARLQWEKKRHNERMVEYSERTRVADQIRKHHGKDKTGYLGFLAKEYPAIASLITTSIKVWLGHTDITPHGYFTGGTGSGKSSLLKLSVWNKFVREKNSSIVIIDPHGDLAESVARLKINYNNDRLIYFDPFLAKDRKLYPVINPFDLKDATIEKVDSASEALAEVFSLILKEGKGSGTDLTHQMNALLKPCLDVLLSTNETSLLDLQRFMLDDENEDLCSLGMSYPFEGVSNFFKTKFKNKQYDSSKSGISSKISTFTTNYALYKTLIGNVTIDLEEEIENGKLIIFNLGRAKGKAKDIIGKFIVARLMDYAEAREEIPEENRIPVYLYIDEAQNYITTKIDKILRESRKFRLYMTLIQQNYLQGFDSELKDSIVGNTKYNAHGLNEDRIYRKITSEIGVNTNNLDNLNEYEFYIKRGKKPGLNVRVNYLDDTFHMSNTEWEETKQEQIKRYYRPSKEHGSKPSKKRVQQSNTDLSNHAKPITADGGIEDLG
jgi:hypothetical protein